MIEPPKRLTEDLGALFADLERRARATTELAAKVRAGLDVVHAEHVISAISRGETLVVVADCATWCTHIRYAQQRLLDHLHAAGETQFTKLKVKVGRPEKKLKCDPRQEK